MKIGNFKSGSAVIYYELYGDAPEVLVMLHGNGGSCKNFKNQIPFFEKYFTVLAIDSRGHGESTFGKAELSLGKMAVDVEAVCKNLGFDKINVLGFSDGANIAMLLAIRNPQLIDRLILVGGNYNYLGFTPVTGAMIMAGYIMSGISGLIDKRSRANKELIALMVKEPRLKRKALRAIKAKTLVVNGNKDMIRCGHAKAMADTIPNAKLKIVNGDHFYLFKEPEAFNKIVYDFMNEE